MTRSGPEHEGNPSGEQRRSASAEAAALRWEESHPVDPEEPAPTPADRPSRPGDRRSAAADAAALRWREQHPDDEEA